jgi:hypothetical protein
MAAMVIRLGTSGSTHELDHVTMASLRHTLKYPAADATMKPKVHY